MSDDLSLDTDSIMDACNAILHEVEINKPYVFEPEFIEKVIPLLVRPWDEANLKAYRQYVHELTNELRILSYEPNPVLIDVVPALYPRPSTTVADESSATVGNLVTHLQQERVKSPFPQDKLLTDFLAKISIRQSVEETVLRPLAILLAKYGRVFEDDDGNPLYTLDGSILDGSETNEDLRQSESSFTDEYED